MSDINLVVLGDSDSEFWNWGWFFDAYSGVKDHVTQQNDYACTSEYTGLVSSASPKQKNWLVRSTELVRKSDNSGIRVYWDLVFRDN